MVDDAPGSRLGIEVKVFVRQVKLDASEAVMVGVGGACHQFEITVKDQIYTVAVLEEMGGIPCAANILVVLRCTEPARVARGMDSEEAVQLSHEVRIDHARAIISIV